MDLERDLQDFLISRRARITPALVGLPTFGDRRRVPGLRREEVASLAGVSVDYYARLERGNLRGVSESVLDALARALHLDDTERAHLFDLARAANTRAAPSRAARSSKRLRPSLQNVLAGMTIPAYLRDAAMNIVAANDLCIALYGNILIRERLPLNLARFVFLDARAHAFFQDWEAVADDTVASLRREVGHNPFDRSLSDIVGELSTRSDQFSARWARHDVRAHRTAHKVLHNDIVGDIALTGDAFELPGDGLTLIAYTAQPESQAAEQLAFLASWVANRQRPHETTPVAPADGSRVD